MFLNRWGLSNIITLDGSSDARAEAQGYQAKLEAIPESILPRDADGFPVFDLALIGVGDDGHSTYFIACMAPFFGILGALMELPSAEFSTSWIAVSEPR